MAMFNSFVKNYQRLGFNQQKEWYWMGVYIYILYYLYNAGIWMWNMKVEYPWNWYPVCHQPWLRNAEAKKKQSFFLSKEIRDGLSETPGINFTRRKMDLTSKKHGVFMGFDVCVALFYEDIDQQFWISPTWTSHPCSKCLILDRL